MLARRWGSDDDSVAISMPGPIWLASAMLGQTSQAPPILSDCDPWSLIENVERVVAAPNDEIALLAAAAGKTVIDSASGELVDRAASLERLYRRIDAFTYHDPFSGRPILVGEWVEQLADWRRLIDSNRRIGITCGIAMWKREAIASFLWAGRPATITRTARTARLPVGKAVAIWPSRVSPNANDRLKAADIPIVRIEDGFIRSEGLGTHLHPPQSIIVDHAGIYYDPRQASDLERLLAEAVFDKALCARARRLIRALVVRGITKYAASPLRDIHLPRANRRVLVAGQVADDRSVQFGRCDVRDTLDLLRRAREAEPNAYIVFKPHPDVVSGLRKGPIAAIDALEFADVVLPDAPMASLLDQVDAVHVLTSLTGFEALLRGREVVTHGHPFYAGWGLTRDLAPPIERRGRQLTLEELVAAALILYPRYRDPITGLPCPPEVLVGRLGEHRPRRTTFLQGLRAVQGRLVIAGRAMGAGLR